jgi:DNA modification methylase
MAPELALASLNNLTSNSLVLDPMSGSGTVVRQATNLGHAAIGFDMDPLAVLMGSVWTTPVDDALIEKIFKSIIQEARSLDEDDIYLPWIDDDGETSDFISFWFAARQRVVLRRIAFVLYKYSKRRFSKEKRAATDVIKVAFSRIIVTKERGASLARDTSHSRPHKVAEDSDFDVWEAMDRSVRQVRQRLKSAPPSLGAQISRGDARDLTSVENGIVDVVLTSPPYLNAIDYLRGHRMSLVWLGYQIKELRFVRSTSIGAERAPDKPSAGVLFKKILDSMCVADRLPSRHRSIVERYCEDVYRMVSEISRVLKPGGKATFVVGNSCLKGNFISNSNGVSMAAEMLGFFAEAHFERELPNSSRYLPVMASGALGKRMRTETILTFRKE